MLRGLRVVLSLFVLALSFSALTIAQTTATLSGTVTDSSGAVLPNTQIAVVNTATGVKRSATADASGRFLVSQLPPGPYEVTATSTGFETLTRQGITLTVGQDANLALTMKVGAVTEQVTVTGEAPIVNTSSSSVSGVVDEKRIEELPLNGRDFSQLPLVQPGVTAIRNGDVNVSKGYGTRIAMGGSRPDQTAWLLDGTNVHSPSNFGTPGSAAGVMLGVEAVREFQVLTSNYSAELGGTSGGVVNMVTKSGTNNLHGSAFEFLRNSHLDARNFFDKEKPAFKRNQFGASLGGAIKKDKTFFFGNYEGLRQRQSLTVITTVPDAQVHQGIVSGTPVAIAPEIRPFLDLFPLPNGPVKGGGAATLILAGNSPVNENYFVVRVDHHFNDKQSIFARFTYDQGNATIPDTNTIPISSTKSLPSARYTTVQHDLILTPQFLMTTRVAYNRTLLLGDDITLVPYSPSLDLFQAGYLPQIQISGLNILGPTPTNLVHRAQNLYNIEESVQYIHGSHSMKFGFDFDKIGTNKQGEVAGSNGTLGWNTIQSFLQDGQLNSIAAVAVGSNTGRSFRQYIYGSYLQDDWKMRPNFTWNLGVRYEPFTVPTDKWGRISTMKDWLHDSQFLTNIGLFHNPSKKNFSPRVGFAWDPKGNGKTAIRSGFGLFFVDLLGPYYITPGQKGPPFFAATASVLPGMNLKSAPSDLARISPGLLSPFGNPSVLCECIQYFVKPSYEMKFNLSVERQLPSNVSVSAGYLGGRGVHLWRTHDANDPSPIQVNGRSFVVNGTPRPNPNLGASSTRSSDAQSFYNALQVEVKKRFSHGFQFQSSYTWSKNIDDSTTGIAATDFTPGGNGVSSQPYSPKADRGLSSLHVGQTFVVNGIYALPSPAHAGFVSALFGGWQIASIFTANSGAPFSVYVSGRNAPDGSRFINVQFPDRVAGRNSSNIMTSNPNQIFDPKAFILPPAAPAGFPAGSGFYGNAGRNTLIGPGLLNFDFSLHKSTPLGLREGMRLDFSADFFNLFNRANFANPRNPQSQVLNPTTGAYIAGAGQITGTVTNSRQLQFGLKLIF